MEHRWNETDRGKPKYSGEKTCPIATLSTTNPTWTDPGSNPGLRGGRPATNRLSHGTALAYCVASLLSTVIRVILKTEAVRFSGSFWSIYRTLRCHDSEVNCTRSTSCWRCLSQATEIFVHETGRGSGDHRRVTITAVTRQSGRRQESRARYIWGYYMPSVSVFRCWCVWQWAVRYVAQNFKQVRKH
jgi:hypothetical protein